MPYSEDREAGRALIDQRVLRDVLGLFATGVTVVTARGPDGEPVGITVNSFTSVSLDPPLVLWCLARTASSVDVFAEGAPFAVNILSDDQLEQARQFARPGLRHFEHARFRVSERGVPCLEDCVATVECQVSARYPGGDHVILVARVEALRQRGEHPLVFFGGQFRRLGSTHVGGEARPSWFPWLDD